MDLTKFTNKESPINKTICDVILNKMVRLKRSKSREYGDGGSFLNYQKTTVKTIFPLSSTVQVHCAPLLSYPTHPHLLLVDNTLTALKNLLSL